MSDPTIPLVRFLVCPDFGQIMQQAQRDARAGPLARSLGTKTVEAGAGGGMVSAVVAPGELVKLRIDPQVIDAKTRRCCKTLIVAAVNQALQKPKRSKKKKRCAAPRWEWVCRRACCKRGGIACYSR